MRLVAAALCGIAMLSLAVSPVLAAQQEIPSAGPLTRVIISDDLTCQVAHRDDTQFELFGGEIGSCGTFLAVGGTVYGPQFGGATSTAWTPVGQTPPTGSGSGGDPFRLLTVVDATAAGLRVQQTDSYVVGSQSYRTDIQLTNAGPAPVAGILYRGGDCYLQNDDTGYGRIDNGAPACIVNPAEGRRIEQWTPITPGSHYFEGHYGEVYSIISSQEHFPDRCDCNQDLDNGAGLSWPVSLAPGASVVISHETFFSPVGRGPVQQPFRDSVPDPTGISLDPVVVATSIAVTAGVIVLVPFPSALFNSTLEENYEEVMAGVARVRGWLRRNWDRFVAWVRGQIAARRAARSAQPLTTPILDPSSTPPAVQPVTQPLMQPSDGMAPPATRSTLAKPDFWRTPQGLVLFVVVSALLYGFLDPTFGLSLTSLATFAGLAMGLLVVVAAYGLPLLAFARSRRVPLTVRALPATLVIGVVCVVISRVVSFQPGYLYGLIIGFIFARGVATEHEARAEALAAASSLLVAFLAWVGLALLRGGAAGGEDSLVTAALEAASVTIVVAGLENAVFAMLPMRFLPGAAVFAWDRRIWAVLIGLGLFGFVHVLLNPSAGYLADTTRTSFFTLIVLLVAFAAVSVLFWAWFRFRPSRPSPTPPAPPAQPQL
jgi:hypothetical protein